MSLATHVRNSTPDDAEWFVGHVHALLAEPDVPIPLRSDEFAVTAAQQAELFRCAEAVGDLYLVAEVNGERVGELNLRRGTRAAFKHWVTLGMSVARQWRNLGVGSALMQRGIEWARATDAIRRIELYVYSTNLPARALYERFGFVVEGQRRGAIRAGDRFVDDLFMAYYVR